MKSIKKRILEVVFFTIIICSSNIVNAQQKTFGEELTEIFQEHWPYKAFLAIPKINDITPRLIIPIDSFGKVKEGSRCAEVDDLDLLRELNPKAVLPREKLYRLSCKALLTAIGKIDTLPIPRNGFKEKSNLVLKFYFGTGEVQVLTY